MADLTWTSADLANGTAADATKVQEKFNDIATYLNTTPSASSGLTRDNIFHNHNDMCFTFVIAAALPDVGSVFTLRTTLDSGIAYFAPTRLTISMSAGTATWDAGTGGKEIDVFVDLLSHGTFGSEVSMLSTPLTDTYDTSNAEGKVFSVSSFTDQVASGGDTILIKAYKADGSTPAAIGTMTTICLYGQARLRELES